ncbi:MAG TPA: hypothetical protein VKB62_10025, partial [Streptosporangiaceae bacterium]|nr:hypothetical protein [Streptosporangiaceae bacterium]
TRPGTAHVLRGAGQHTATRTHRALRLTARYRRFAVRGLARQMPSAPQLYLCGHCTAQLRPALWAQGWTIWSTADDSPGQRAAA